MKLFIIILIAYSYTLFGQTRYDIYLEESPMLDYPQIAKYEDWSVHYQVIIDVINLEPKIIHINCLDSTDYYFFRKVTEENVKKLLFINDVKNYSIYFDYLTSKKISNDYTEYVEPGHIKVVSRQMSGEFIDFSLHESYDSSNFSLTIEYYVSTHKKINKPSNILVERYFIDNKDSSKIIRNNFPQLSSEILEEASHFKKNDFLSMLFISKEEKSQIKNYFVKLKVIRWFGDRGYYKIY